MSPLYLFGIRAEELERRGRGKISGIPIVIDQQRSASINRDTRLPVGAVVEYFSWHMGGLWEKFFLVYLFY